MKRYIPIIFLLFSCGPEGQRRDDSFYKELEDNCANSFHCLEECDFDTICNNVCADIFPDSWMGARKTLLTCDLDPESDVCSELMKACVGE